MSNESLSHVVEQITGIRVRETVPDPVLNQADEVDLARRGVVSTAQAGQCLSNQPCHKKA